MSELFTAEALTAFFQVVMIDLVLAGDNAVVIGLAAAGLPQEQRGKAIVIGVIAATVLRILLRAASPPSFSQIIGLLLAGGVLLLWVCWKMWRELRTPAREHAARRSRTRTSMTDGRIAGHAQTQDLRAGRRADRHRRRLHVARQRAGRRRRRARASVDPGVRPRPVGALMGIAATFIARLLQAPLDRLCRPRRDPLCFAAHDLSRLDRGFATRHGGLRRLTFCPSSGVSGTGGEP